MYPSVLDSGYSESMGAHNLLTLHKFLYGWKNKILKLNWGEEKSWDQKAWGSPIVWEKHSCWIMFWIIKCFLFSMKFLAMELDIVNSGIETTDTASTWFFPMEIVPDGGLRGTLFYDVNFQGGSFKAMVQLGYKTDGYLLGEKLVQGFIVRAGIAFLEI